MPTPAETKAIREFLLENPQSIEVAYLVHETWPSVRDEVCKEFLGQVLADIKTDRFLCECGTDLKIALDYGGHKRNSNWVRLIRESWNTYAVTSDVGHPHATDRIAIVLENASNGPNSWFINVRTPEAFSGMDNSGRDRRKRIQEDLKRELGQSDGKIDHWLPWWRYVSQEFRNWDPLVHQLRRECKSPDDGEIKKYFVKTFVDVAKTAIPVIDKIECANLNEK